jgi:hypothetical protein
MPIAISLSLLSLLVLIEVSAVFAVRLRSNRSPFIDQYLHIPRPTAPVAAYLVLAVVTFVAGSYSSQTIVFLALTVASLVGATLIQARLRRLLTTITTHYLDRTSWQDIRFRGPGWRYEMKYEFIERPEYVDALILSMVRQYPTYSSFRDAILKGTFPPEYADILDKRFWGFGLPTVRKLANEVVIDELFRGQGPYAPSQSADDIYHELRDLVRGDKVLLMDRWQYYWALRNLNFVTALVSRALSPIMQAIGIAGIMIAFGIAATVSTNVSIVDSVLRSVAAGSLVWVVFVCGGTSLLIVSIFRGTGTFAISFPTSSHDYDPIWTEFIQLGILAFSVSFLTYGIGMPFLLMPQVLSKYPAALDGRFMAYSVMSFVLCLLIFLNHAFGTHTLMASSKANALERVERELRRAAKVEDRSGLVERHIELQRLRVWPFRRAVVAQLLLGIVLPALAQGIAVYSSVVK